MAVFVLKLTVRHFVLLLLSLGYMQSQDVPAFFHGTCRVAWVGIPTYPSTCFVQDMKLPGYHNRWRIVIEQPVYVAVQPKSAVFLNSEALADGKMRFTAQLMVNLEITPNEPAIANNFIVAAGAYEGRAQNVTMSYLPGGELELFLEETAADFDGPTRTPTDDWWARHRETMHRLSRAR